MKAVVLAVLVSFSAFAADDAPKVEVMDGGVFVPDAVRIAEGKNYVALKAENENLKAHMDSNIPVWVVIGVGVLAAGAGAAATYGVMKATGSAK